MNDEQLVQLFAAQKIPPATDAAKAAALSAAMQAFAAQPAAGIDTQTALPPARTQTDNTAQLAPAATTDDKTAATPQAPLWGNLFGLLRRLGRTAAEPKPPGRYSLNPPAARYSGLLAVAGLHIGVVLALVVGLSPLNEMGSSEQVNIVVLDEAPHKEVAAAAAPAAPLVDLALAAPQAEAVEFSIAAEKAAPASSSVARAAAKTDAKRVEIAEAKTAAKAPPTAAPAKSAQPKTALTAPAYPKDSKKLGEQGAVALALFIDEQGGVREARVESSSGFKRLNDAAVNHALTAWAFAPCTEGNKPIGCWLKIKIIFNLKEG